MNSRKMEKQDEKSLFLTVLQTAVHSVLWSYIYPKFFIILLKCFLFGSLFDFNNAFFESKEIGKKLQ